MKQFHFAIVVHGECCIRGHLWIESYAAKTLKGAVGKMRREVVKAGYTPVEWAQLPSPHVLAQDSTPEGEKYIEVPR